VQMVYSISELPNLPAVYALYGGKGRNFYVAYIGTAGKLKQRIDQHLVRRDSSVAIKTSAVGINADHVTAVKWWEHVDFRNKNSLLAAEMIAADLLDPALKSRGLVSASANTIYQDKIFKKDMRSLFRGQPTGYLTMLTLQDAFDHIRELELQVKGIEKQISVNLLSK